MALARIDVLRDYFDCPTYSNSAATTKANRCSNTTTPPQTPGQ